MSKDDVYEVIRASSVEIGLLKNGKGVRTWWDSEFSEFPDLNHPKIQAAIAIEESQLKDRSDA